MVVYFYPDMPHHVIVYHLTVTLSSLNSCMDPVVYCFVTNNFQVRVALSAPVHLSMQSSLQPRFVHPSLIFTYLLIDS